jgi:hypothetical protein
MPDGSRAEYAVEDYAYRLYRRMGGDLSHLPKSFVHALEMSAMDHMKMIAAVQPYIDAAVSKTVNVPEDYPFKDFRELYLQAWKAGLKGITTYRPNNVIGSVLEVKKDTPGATAAPQDLKDDPDRRVRLDCLAVVTRACLLAVCVLLLAWALTDNGWGKIPEGSPISKVDNALRGMKPLHSEVSKLPDGRVFVCLWFDNRPRPDSLDFTWRVVRCKLIRKGPAA